MNIFCYEKAYPLRRKGLKMAKIVVIGGGWAGVAAAVRAKKRGHDVCIFERTDMLLGLGNVGGIMRNNGRFTAAEENIALGADELFGITDKNSTHRNIDFPGHRHASFYDAAKVEPQVAGLLKELGVKVSFMTRIVDVRKNEKIEAVVDADGNCFEADAFIEATGTTGPMGNCMRYGNGCSMCVLRCPAFGPRVSIAEKAGNMDLMAAKADGTRGAFSGSCKLEKKSLSREIQKKLDKEGVVVIPLPKQLINRSKLARKVCQQYALDEFAENIILLDTGEAKLMTSFFNLQQLRTVPGFENARFLDPYAGGKGNSVRYMAVGLRDKNMRAKGIENLFLAGEKSGFFVGHTEAITTGSLAGYNASRYAEGGEMLELSEQLAVGDIIKHADEALKDEDCLARRFTFAGGEYFERMKERDLYTCNVRKIRKKVKELGLVNVYNM